MKLKLIALGVLLSSAAWGQPRICHKGYTLQKDGRCIGKFPAGDGCNIVTRDQDNPSYGETTAMACMPKDGWTGPVLGSDSLVMGYSDPAPRDASWEESIQNGSYVATFTDPQNKWRCYVTSYPETLTEINSITLTCVKPHEVQTSKP